MARDPIAEEAARQNQQQDLELARTGVPSGGDPVVETRDLEQQVTGVPAGYQSSALPSLTPTQAAGTPQGPPLPDVSQFSPNLLRELGQNAPGWTDDDYMHLEFSLRSTFLDIDPKTLNDTIQAVMSSGDATILDLPRSKFIRHVGMTTQDMFEERSLIRMLGGVPADEAFNNAAIDTILETGGAVRTASQVFAESQQQKQWFTAQFLENRDRRERVIAQVQQRSDGLLPPELEQDWRYVTAPDAVTGLRGQQIEWVAEDGQLAMRFYPEDFDAETNPGYTDVLIYLEPGTEVLTPTDALTEYLLADNGLRHAMAATSGEVPGRQTIAGNLIEGTDNVIKAVERFGSGVFGEFISGAQSETAAAINGIAPIQPNVSEQERDQEALREQETREAVSRSVDESGIVFLTRKYMAEHPDAAMSNVVAAGIAGWTEIPDDVKEAQVVQSITDLETAAAANREEQSMIGRFIEEDVAPPVMDVLQAWDSAIQFVGIVAHDLTNIDAWKDIADAVNENGIDALLSPQGAVDVMQALNPMGLDTDFMLEQFDEVRREGIPNAVGAYIESVNEIGDMATYYGIDPDSSWAGWVNGAASVAFDPITWATLGGNASWTALKKGVTTVTGAERLVKSRPLMSAARNLVDNNSVHILPLLSSGGMSSNGIRRLAQIARTTYPTKAARVEAMQQALDVFRHELPAYGGTWLPAGPARVLRRKTTMGLANMALLTPKDSKARGFVQDLLLRASNRRYAHITERSFLDEMFDVIQIRRLNDTDGMADDIIAALDIYDAHRYGDQATAMLQGRAQVLKQELEDLAVFPAEVGQVPRLRGQVREWDDSVKELTDRLDRMAADDPARAALEQSRQRAIQNRDEIQALLDAGDGRFTGAYDERVKTIAAKRDELAQNQAQMESLGMGARDRSLLEQHLHRYMDQWADEWGVPVKTTPDGATIAHPFVPDLPLRDWSAVTGQSGMRGRSIEQAGQFEAFGEAAAQLRQLGMGSVAGVTPMPVSPYELLVWHTMQRNAATRAMWNTFQAHPGIKKAMDGLQGIWAASVLFNPRTALRSSLDEVVRFYEDAGMSRDLVKSTTPKAVTGGVGPEARNYSRQHLGSILASNQMPWKIVNPADRGMWIHAERWVNGTLVRDPVFKAYARAVTNGADEAAARELWEQWWNETGVKLAKTSTVNGTPITARNSFDLMQRSMDTWLAGIGREGKRRSISSGEVRDAIFRAAANNEAVDVPQAVWRQMPPVPAQLSTRAEGAAWRHPLETGFEVSYGMPQQRRGMVFYDHYYDWAYGVHKEAAAGRIIDEDWLLANGLADDMLHAQEIMAQGRRNPQVRQLVQESGMVLEEDLKQAAMLYAEKAADDMMYTFGATSILGKKLARVYPFGRAQADYLQWWWKKLTQPTQWATGQAAGRFNPSAYVNVRLVDRMAHLAQLGNTYDDRPGADTPAGVVSNLTFLPTNIDEGLVVDTTPNLGPMASWMMNLPLDDAVPGWADARNVVEEIHPAQRMFSEPYDSWPEAIIGAFDALFPKGGLTIRNQAAAMNDLLALAAAYVFFDYDPTLPVTDEQQRNLNGFVNQWVMSSSSSPWELDAMKLDQAQWLNENAFDAVPDKNSGSTLMRTWSMRNTQAAISSLQENTQDFLNRVVGAGVYGGSDFQYVETLIPVGDFVDQWVASGSITDAKRDAINLGLELISADEATPKDRIAFADEVLDAVFTQLTPDERTEFFARNPGVAVNLVSGYEVKEQLVPDDARDGIVNGRIRTADLDRARALRQQGREQGWLVARDYMDVRHDTLVSTHRSFREYLDIIYERGTGIPISQRSIEQGGDRYGLDRVSMRLEPEWFLQHRDWLDKVGFQLPPEVQADLVAGVPAYMNAGEFRNAVLETKGRYTYEYELSNDLEAKLSRIGIDDRDPSGIAQNLRSVEGFDMDDWDSVQPLSYYGKDLWVDFNDAVAFGQENFGWRGLDEWETDILTHRFLDDNDEPTEEVFDLNELRARFRVALALSGTDGTPFDTFTESDYTNSAFGRQLGELDWEPPAPPPLEDTRSYTTPQRVEDLHVVDGDTIEVQTESGPAFLRLLGINTPERGQPGYLEAGNQLRQMIQSGRDIQFAIWEPNRYGLKMTTLTEQDNMVVHRDRLFVWLYVDGVPVFDPNQFSRTNVRGVRTGGEVLDLEALWEAQK